MLKDAPGTVYFPAHVRVGERSIKYLVPQHEVQIFVNELKKDDSVDFYFIMYKDA